MDLLFIDIMNACPAINIFLKVFLTVRVSSLLPRLTEPFKKSDYK